MADVVMLDFDEFVRDPVDDESIALVLNMLGLKLVSKITQKESDSGRGQHVYFQIKPAIPASAMVAVQAILGSDPKRETFNLMRALCLDGAPDFWRERWNVLYSKKLH